MPISRLMKSCCSALKGVSTPQHLALLSFGQWASSFIKPGQNKNTIECFFHPIDRWGGLCVTMTWANSPAQMSNCKPAIRKRSEWLWPFSYSLWQLLLSLSICFKCSLSFSWFSNVMHIKTPELKHAPHCKCRSVRRLWCSPGQSVPVIMGPHKYSLNHAIPLLRPDSIFTESLFKWLGHAHLQLLLVSITAYGVSDCDSDCDALLTVNPNWGYLVSTLL